MGYFLPSFLQKRILRYALSRLELLDTGNLDLDNLDINLGKRSTVELRDIAVSTSKLSTLLHLPPALTLSKARVSLLRITIPSDLYNSGIVVEVDGVNIRLNTGTKGKKADSTNTTSGEAKSRTPRSGIRNVASRTKQADNIDSGSPRSHMSPSSKREDEDTYAEVLPTTLDLAQSFLQAEPPEERAEIQAVVAESQKGQYQVLGESIEDSAALGVGGGFSLPGFVAGFLKGIRDRLHLSIMHVDISLDTQIELPVENADAHETSVKTEILTIRFSLEKVEANEITTSRSMPDSPVRRIAMRNIQGMIISDTSLFTNLSRLSVPPSPQASRTSPSGSSSGRGETLASVPVLATSSPHSQSSDPGLVAKTRIHREDAFDATIPVSASDHARPLEKMYDVGESSQIQRFEQTLGLDQNQHQDGALAGSFYSQVEAGHVDSEAQASIAITESHKHDRRLHHPSSGVQSPMTYESTGVATSDTSSGTDDREFDEATTAGESSMENLTASRIFSHEEAESMYMSAMSHGLSLDDRSRHKMPGNWDSTSDDELSTIGVNVPRPSQRDQMNCECQMSETQKIAQAATKEAKPPAKLWLNNPRPAMNTHGTVHGDLERSATDALRPTDQISSNGSEGSSAKSDAGLYIVKKFASIDSVIIELPENDDTPTTSSSSTHHDPALSEELPNPKGKVTGQNSATQELGTSSGAGHGTPSKNSTLANSIQAGDVLILGDIDLTKLTIMVMQKLMDATKQKRPNEKATEALSTDQYYTKLVIRHLTWQFLDNVKGFTTSESQNIDPETRAAPMLGDSDVLLKALIKNLEISVGQHGTSLTSTTLISKFVFGYGKDTVLAFDSGLKLRESNRDILAPVDHDIVLKVSRSPERMHAELTTLPLHVHLDLRRLDETFGWFGGFSSILGLGNSMISTVTVTETISKSSATKNTSGVRFEDTAPPLQQYEAVSSPQQKITARLGGIVFDLEGSSSAFRLETSAVKVVSRAEGIGLSIDRVNLAGPYIVSRDEKPSIDVKFAGLRAEYLSFPKEVDLTRLLALLCPSKDNYEQDEDILVDTLLRQRRQGAVVRVSVDRLEFHLLEVQDLKYLPALGDELRKLSTVAKYLPEDDRPGIMTLCLIRNAQMCINAGSEVGTIKVLAETIEAAYISLPSLAALAISLIEIRRNDIEELLGSNFKREHGLEASVPMVMARFIGNEPEPTVKVKLQGLRVEYHVNTVMAFLGFRDNCTTEQLVSDLMASVATVAAQPEFVQSPSRLSTQTSVGSEDSKSKTSHLGFALVIRDVIVGLNPRCSAARGIVVLFDTRVAYVLPKCDEASASLEVNKACFLAIDNTSSLKKAEDPTLPAHASLLQSLSALGYVTLSEVSAVKAALQFSRSGSEADNMIDFELRDALLVIETCADSTQTLQVILSGLQPPMPPSQDLKYRTEVVPVEDMLASFSGDAIATHRQSSHGISESPHPEYDKMEEDSVQDLEFVSSFYGLDSQPEDDIMSDRLSEENSYSRRSPRVSPNIGEGHRVKYVPEQAHYDAVASTLDFREDHFGNNSTVGGTAHRWDSKRNTYELSNDLKLRASPLKLRLRGVHVIWNLFDGYDWIGTRDTISQAVAAVEGKAMEQRSRRHKRRSADVEDEEDSVIGDFLFNSIYIGISAKHDPKDLSRQINRNIDDLASESESIATSTSSNSSSRQARVPQAKSRKLRLIRSKSHKITFEMKGVSADLVVFPAEEGEVQSSIDVRVQDLEIFDHLPTSTWKKFATYMHDAGERESGTSMIHIEMLNVKPVPDLAASEIILKVRHFTKGENKANHDTGYHPSLATSCRSRCSGLHDSVL